MGGPTQLATQPLAMTGVKLSSRTLKKSIKLSFSVDRQVSFRGGAWSWPTAGELDAGHGQRLGRELRRASDDHRGRGPVGLTAWAW